MLKVQGIRQKERIRWNQQNCGHGCVKNQEVDGQKEVERDQPGQEFEHAIDAVNTREIASVH